MWRWYLIADNDEVKQRIKDAHNDMDFTALVELLNGYRISPERLSYCCSYQSVMDNVKSAIESGEV